MRRLPVLALAAATAVLAVPTLALAGGGGTPSAPPIDEPVVALAPHGTTAPTTVAPRVATTVAVATPTTMEAAAAPGATTTTEAPVEVVAAERIAPAPRIEPLRLACEGVAAAPGRGVACRWSASHHPGFAGYRLVRGDGDERVVVLRTRDVDVVRHLDTSVTPGQRYRYAIQVVDAHGRVIGAGGPAVAGIPEPPRQTLRFACDRASDGGHRGIACRWSAATGEVRGYVLYRSVDGGAREAIHGAAPAGRLGHFDGPLRPGHRYTYAVVALGADGEVLGGGGPVTIGIPATPPDPPGTRATG